MQAIRLELRAVGFREGQRWITHCLELDIVGQGDTPQESVQQLAELVDLQIRDAIESSDLRSIFFPAPAELWDLYARATTHAKPKGLTMPKQVDRFDYRAVAYA